jgi:hypothetical protein
MALKGQRPRVRVRAPKSQTARARALLRDQLKHGPKPGAQIEAAARAAEIPTPVLLAAAVRTNSASAASAASGVCRDDSYPRLVGVGSPHATPSAPRPA